MKQIQVHPVSAVFGGLVICGALLVSSMQSPSFNKYSLLSAEQAQLLKHMSIVYLDDGQGGQAKTIRFTGVNVQVVNGLGATNGNPLDPGAWDPPSTATNGLGNLIIGYNEPGNPVGDDRTGSHVLAIGNAVNFSGFGGQVVGWKNQVSGAYASVSGGGSNTASGIMASISGGSSGTASGFLASISGGNAGTASGQTSSVVGGQLNVASGLRSCVTGGGSNQARAEESVVVGGGHAFDQGQGNVCDGIRSTIVGGSANRTNGAGHTSVVGGGYGRTTTGLYHWAAGGLSQEN